ncbi:MAG: terminase family protein [Negativicutes bacterium]
MIGLPANPDTARGFSGNVVLDEFAFHRDSRKIWTALYPTITRGYKIRIISTPNGKSGKFYELWSARQPLEQA